MAQGNQQLSDSKLTGKLIIGELLRNMELGRFDMTYTVLLPCVFTIYLNPEDHAMLKGVFPLIIDDARRSLRARVSELNAHPSKLGPGKLGPSKFGATIFGSNMLGSGKFGSSMFGVRRSGASGKEHKIACHDWMIEFFPDSEVPAGDVEIHSELSEAPEPAYRGTKTTLLERAPTAATQRVSGQPPPATNRPVDAVYAELRYQDDSGAQVYPIAQNSIRIGRGGEDQRMDLVLYTTDEVSRAHLQIRRDGATGAFFIKDTSTNGTSVNGKRLRKDVEEVLPNQADIKIGDVLTLVFEVRK